MEATAEEVRRALVEATRKTGSAKLWAAEHDFSPAFVSRALSGQVPPSARMRAVLGFAEVPADHVRQARVLARSRARKVTGRA